MARWVGLCSVNFPGQGSWAANWHHASQLLEQALYDHPDLILLPETFTGLGMSEQDWFNTAEPVDGETITRLRDIARQHRTYIACPILLSQRSAVHNAIVLLNRDGEIAGSYYKMFPTLGELSSGRGSGCRGGSHQKPISAGWVSPSVLTSTSARWQMTCTPKGRSWCASAPCIRAGCNCSTGHWSITGGC
jgi:predicted amidohydrolase